MANEKGYVVVRGGVSGAGRYISLKMAEAGYDVFAHTAEAIHNFRGDILKEECKALGVSCAYDDGDPNVYENAQKIVTDADRELGGKMIAYINNDGVCGGSRLPKMTFAQYREELDMHFLSLLNCAKTAAEHMAKQGGGQFITTVCLMPFPGETPDFSFEISLYEAFTRSLAKTYAPMNVRFNTIISGPLNYPQDPPMPGSAPEHGEHAVQFAPVMAQESPDEFLNMMVNVVQSPGINGQVFALNVRF